MAKTMYEAFQTSQVTVGSTATLIAAASPGADSITIENLGTTAVYIGPTNGVTTGNGFLLPGAIGASITFPANVAVYGIVAAGSQAVAVLQTI